MGILKGLFEPHGASEHLGSNNGRELIAGRLKAGLILEGTETIYIELGHPGENGYGEGLIAKLRGECLNEELFYSARCIRVLVETWRKGYNAEGLYSSLGYRAPAEVAGESVVASISSGEGAELTS